MSNRSIKERTLMTNLLAKPIAERLENNRRHKPFHRRFPTVWTDHSFDKTRTDLSNLARRHEKDRGDLRTDVCIDVTHDTLVLEVRWTANATENVCGPNGTGVSNEIAVIKDSHRDGGCWDARRDALEREPLLVQEEREHAERGPGGAARRGAQARGFISCGSILKKKFGAEQGVAGRGR